MNLKNISLIDYLNKIATTKNSDFNHDDFVRKTLQTFIHDESLFLEAYDILEPALFDGKHIPYFTNSLMKNFYEQYPPDKINQKPLKKMIGLMDKETENYYRSQYVDNPIVASLWPENKQKYPTIAHWFEHLNRVYQANGYAGLKKSIEEQNLFKPLKMQEGRNTNQFACFLSAVVKKPADLQKLHDDFGIRPDLAMAYGAPGVQTKLLQKMPEDVFSAYLKRLSQDQRLLETTIDQMAVPHISTRAKINVSTSTALLAARFGYFLNDIQKNKLSLERLNRWLDSMGDPLIKHILKIDEKHSQHRWTIEQNTKDPVLLLANLEKSSSHHSLDEGTLKFWQECTLRTIAGAQTETPRAKI